MDTPAVVKPAEQPLDLPHTRMLGYLANGRPTRVRRIAAWGVAISGLLLLLPALYMLFPLWMVVVEPLVRAPGPVGWAMVRSRLLEAWRDGLAVWVLGDVIVSGGAIMALWMTVRGVARGARGSCQLARAALWVPVLECLLTVAGVMSFAVLGIGDHDLAAWAIAFLVGGSLVLLVMLMLMLDLHAFLGWIAQRPFEEKPATPFLPKRAATGATPTAAGRS